MHPTLVLRSWLLAALIGAAIAAPGASGAQGPRSSRTADPRSPVMVEVRRDGFDWADAGVGAAAAFAVVAIAAGVAPVVRSRHDRRSAQDTS